jgi:nucleoside 2-deoxyribosyltransferase
MSRYVYLAGPYTHPDPVENTNKTILVADALRDLGFVPFVPHMTLLWHMVKPHEPDYWYAYDLEWLAQCDVLLRLPGDSWGADEEVKFAIAHDIPVVRSVDELLAWCQAREYVVMPEPPDGPSD